jgi:uncharacterized protein YyaL (SSP411 family)
MPLMSANLALWHGRRAEVVIVGTPGSPDRLALERVVADHYLPWAVTLFLETDVAPPARLPWLKSMTTQDGRATAYVCHEFTCQTPTTDPATLASQLEDASAPRRIILA